MQSVGAHPSLVSFTKVLAEGRERQRVGCGIGAGVKALPPLILIFQDAPNEMGAEGLSAPGSHPRETRDNKGPPEALLQAHSILSTIGGERILRPSVIAPPCS